MKSHKNISLNDNDAMVFTILTDYRLWNTLFPGFSNLKPHKFSKAEAFFDLINRQRLSWLTNDDDYINISMQGLANIWGWDRSAVKRFLEQLETIGAVTVISTGQRSIAKIVNFKVETININSEENIVDNDNVQTAKFMLENNEQPDG